MEIRRGMRVIDIGCPLLQSLRADGIEPPAKEVTVLRVFSWGLRVVHGGDVYDSTRFVTPQDSREG